MQCASAILSAVACLALEGSSTLSHKGTIFQRKLLNIKRVFIYSINLSEKFFILRRIELHMTINMYRSLCKTPVMLVRL